MLWDPATPTDDPSFDDPHLASWEVLPDDSNPERLQLLCPGCQTLEEQKERTEADAAAFEQWRRGKGAAEYEAWKRE